LLNAERVGNSRRWSTRLDNNWSTGYFDWLWLKPERERLSRFSIRRTFSLGKKEKKEKRSGGRRRGGCLASFRAQPERVESGGWYKFSEVAHRARRSLKLAAVAKYEAERKCPRKPAVLSSCRVAPASRSCDFSQLRAGARVPLSRVVEALEHRGVSLESVTRSRIAAFARAFSWAWESRSRWRERFVPACSLRVAFVCVCVRARVPLLSLSLSLCVCVCACVFPERASKFIYSPGLPGCIALMVLALRNSAIFNSPPPIDTGRAFEIDKTKRIRCMSISHVSPLLTCNVKFSGRPGSTVRRMPSRIYSQSFRAPSASRLLLLRPLCSIHISLPSPPPRPHSSPSFSFGVKRAIFIASIVFTYISSIPRFEDDKIRLAERETVIRRNEITGRLDERYAVCLYLERRPLWLEINFGGEPCEMRRNRTWKRDIVVSSLVTFSISTLASSQWSNDLRIKAIKLRTSRRDTRARQRNIRKNLASLCENRDFRDHIAVTFVHENRCAYRSESPSYEEKYEKCEKCKQEIANYESENGQSG